MQPHLCCCCPTHHAATASALQQLVACIQLALGHSAGAQRRTQPAQCYVTTVITCVVVDGHSMADHNIAGANGLAAGQAISLFVAGQTTDKAEAATA
jgi:hypothetical protein